MLAPPLIFAALAALFLFGVNREDPDALPSALVGKAAPPVDLVTLAGLPPLTPDLLAEPGVKVVNYWASWCGPCRLEHPSLMQLAEEGVPVLGINYKDDPEKALAFLDELGNPYAAIGADETGRAGIDWGIYGVPETFVVDGDGIIRLRFAGPVTEEMLEKRVRPAIEAARSR